MTIRVRHSSLPPPAECLGLSSANIKIRLHRARACLQQEIDRRIGREVRQLYQFDGERCDRIVRSVRQRIAQARSLP